MLGRKAVCLEQGTGGARVCERGTRHARLLLGIQAREERIALGHGHAAGKPARQKKLKFTFKEQREYDTIEADIAALEARIAQREGEMLACGSDYGKLQDLTKDQQADQAALEEKMDRWLYLTDLAEKIAAQEN